MRWLFSLVIFVGLSGLTWAGQFTPKPPSRDATTDLPASQHHKNVGGSDGAGLCVYTSVWHAVLWGDETGLFGLRAFAERRPGGSYPEKLAHDITLYCKQKGIPEPLYVQHTGGDVAFLELAMKTGRMVGVTYNGRDDFYRGTIAHMVNLVHLDADKAAILDNNRPGVFVWMSRADFLSRWKDGWAVVFLASPPPPYASGNPAPEPPCPLPQPNKPRRPWGEQVGCSCNPCQCDPCQCELTGGVWVGNVNGQEWGYWVNGRCVARVFANGDVYHVDQYGNAVGVPFMNTRGRVVNYGIDLEHMPRQTSYYLGGTRTSRESAMSALTGDGLVDDSTRWNLTVVDAPAPRLGEYATRLHVKVYKSGDWQVAQFGLNPGYTLRKPAVGRVGVEIGTVTDESELYDLLAVLDGKPWPKPKPQPDPDPEPEPQPAPAPAPKVEPKLVIPDWLGGGAAGAILLWLFQLLKGRKS